MSPFAPSPAAGASTPRPILSTTFPNGGTWDVAGPWDAFGVLFNDAPELLRDAPNAGS